MCSFKLSFIETLAPLSTYDLCPPDCPVNGRLITGLSENTFRSLAGSLLVATRTFLMPLHPSNPGSQEHVLTPCMLRTSPWDALPVSCRARGMFSSLSWRRGLVPAEPKVHTDTVTLEGLAVWFCSSQHDGWMLCFISCFIKY